MKGFKKPRATVLGENAVIPEGNLISPAPKNFTHELIRKEPFYYSNPTKDAEPSGEFKSGTKVLLVRSRGRFCRVADKQGLLVEVACDSLKKL